MTCRRFVFFLHAALLALFTLIVASHAVAQSAKRIVPNTPSPDANADHVEERAAWFARGRVIPGKSSADLRYRAYQTKLQMRATRRAQAHAASHAVSPDIQTPPSSAVTWAPLGPVPLASDATGSGLQDYHQVSGRATAVAIDPADPTGNTVFIGGAQGGVWKSTNAANSVANNVTWTPLTDDQPTLATGSMAIQPGNSDPTQSVILVGTGEGNNSADSYFGLGILRSADGGNSWSLIEAANNGNSTVSFSGLGGTRMAFSTATGQTNTVVAAMAASSEGVIDGALTSNRLLGLYTSLDAGQTWTYDALFSGGAAEGTSATSVVYNAAAGEFFAAVRYQGFYSSPDGLTWTPLANQPGGSVLSAAACPQNFVTTCPIYRGEITVVPGRNEMYVWFVSLSPTGQPVDQGIWQSLNGGTSWTQISDSGITNCGDSFGCGVTQGTYNLELLAVPNCPSGAQICTGNPTDLYAGAINLYKCSMSSSASAACNSSGFLNLTHAYGCSPIAELAHVHPAQHALAYMIPTAGSEATAALMYFANDGGIYRALNGFTGLSTESCSGTNAFDDLNQNLGSMTQFVSFSQHPTDPNTLLGGAQGNGFPATENATTSTSWVNVLGGDGAYNAIDPNSPATWFASNPDVPTGGLDIQECGAGVACTDGTFGVVVSSSNVGGDDGAFYFPYILDPQSTTALLVGTCRIWSGPRLGGTYSVLSLNFDTLGTGTCSGGEVNQVRAIAAGGPTDSNGSEVIYATTDGLGPIDSSLQSPPGGNVWVTTNAAAVSGNSSTFANVTNNGPTGSINPNQFPISAVAIDTSDPTGNTAYVTVMGFTGGPGHVWQTTNAGVNWTDFTGTFTSALPDSPVNAVLVDPVAHVVYVGTDVGVFQSSTASPVWGEVGPMSSGGQAGFLPNVAVTALALFNSGGQKILRASTYGRGVWQAYLAPGFEIAVSNATQTVFVGQLVTFNGTLTSGGGYNNSVALICVAGTTSPPGGCLPDPVSVTPTADGASFTVSVGSTGSTLGDFFFGVQGIGFGGTPVDVANLILHVVNFDLTTPSPMSVTAPRGTTSPPVSFQVLAQGLFSQSVTVSCTINPVIARDCNFTPGATVNPPYPPMTASVSVPPGAAAGNYTVTLQATSAGATAPAPPSFTLTVNTNPVGGYTITGPQTLTTTPGGQVTANLTLTSNGYSGQINATCDTSALPGTQCSLTPANPIALKSGGTANLTATITVPTNAIAGTYNINIDTADVSGSPSNTFSIQLTVAQDYSLGNFSPASATIGAGGSASYNFSVLPVGSTYNGSITLQCTIAPVSSASCTFSPNPATTSSGNVLMTVQTQAVSLARPPDKAVLWTFAVGLALPAVVIRGKRSRRRAARLGFVFALLLFLLSCGSGSNGGGEEQQSTNPATYTVTVTGSPASISQPNGSAVTLIVQ
jgi:hypothetical protein